MPLDFTVVVPTRNRPAQLAACLRALNDLAFPKDRFEVIIVDDGSDPPVTGVAAAAGSFQVKVLRQAHGGPALARNRGARAASGEFLAFTDDDCAPDPRWLSALLSALRSAPDALVGGRVVNALPHNARSAASQFIQDFVYSFYNSGEGGARFFATNNMALAARPFHAAGGFDGRFQTSEDRDFCDRWLLARRLMLYVPEAVVRHSHDLTLAQFWKQHVGYGRGARRFYLAHRRRQPGTSTINCHFHWAMLRALPRAVRERPESVRLASLLAVWQVANAAGFAMETVFPVKPGAAEEAEA